MRGSSIGTCHESFTKIKLASPMISNMIPRLKSMLRGLPPLRTWGKQGADLPQDRLVGTLPAIHRQRIISRVVMIMILMILMTTMMLMMTRLTLFHLRVRELPDVIASIPPLPF
jgi:hypothetical protein